MEIKFDLKESKFEGVKYFGTMTIGEDEETIKINVSIRKNKDDLFICLPSRKGTDGEYHNEVFLGKEIYEKANKVLNKKYNK